MGEPDERERVAATILRQGELRLDAQLQLAIASDQRATTLAGIYAAVATALLGWSGWLTTTPDGSAALAAAFSTTAVLLLVAASLCIYVARPMGIATVGAKPETWTDNGALDRSPEEAFLKEAKNYDEYISDNRLKFDKNSQKLNWALGLSVFAPVAGTAVYVAILIIC
jgi:hypothetical protein